LTILKLLLGSYNRELLPEEPMPLTIPLTEEMVRQLAPDEATWNRAIEVLNSDQIVNAGVSKDGSWLIAEAAGPAADPFRVSVDFADPSHPFPRSNAPSHRVAEQFDKYTLALMLKYTRTPDTFEEREPGEDLVLKRDKKVAADDRKKFGPAAPKRPTRNYDKHRAAQRDGFELLEKVIYEIVSLGKWYEKERLEKFDRYGKTLVESHLPLAAYTLRRLIALGKQKGISEEDRNVFGGEVVGQLYAIHKYGKNYFDGTLAEGESQSDADAVSGDVLGKEWNLSELKDKGYARTELNLLEVAYERVDEESRQQRLEISHLLDLSTGEVFPALAARPFKSLTQILEQPSYDEPIFVEEAVLYPGWLNRRIAWEKSMQKRGIEADEALAIAHERAEADFSAVTEAFRDQMRHPLAPREAVFLVRAERVGRINDKITIIEDESGNRIECADRRKDYSNVANFLRAVAMPGMEKPAVLVRLFVQPIANAIYAQPLAVITPSKHLRLGV